MRFQRASSVPRVARSIALIFISLIPAHEVVAQICVQDGCALDGSRQSATVEQRALSLGITALVGGLTAGIRRGLAGESFTDAFAIGLLGGVVGYAGKHVSGQRFTGSGLVGREISAAGASIVLNASEGRKPFDRFIFPIGLILLEYDRVGQTRFAFGLDVTAAIATVYLFARGGSMDWSSSLTAGTPVLIRDGSISSRGRHIAGAIELTQDSDTEMAGSRSHEQVHVAQSDFASVIWSIPLEAWLLPRLGVPERISRRLHFGAHHLLRLSIAATVPYERDPWEIEARVLSGTR